MHYRWLDREGHPVWINCRGRVLNDADGRPHFLVGCINEIGQKQKADNVSGLLGESSLSAYVEQFGDGLPDGFSFVLALMIFGISMVTSEWSMAIIS